MTGNKTKVADQAQLELKRITSQYSPSEDRLRLVGENSEGEKTVLWLTQRLINRLVPQLCERLESVVMGKNRTIDSVTIRSELMNEFAQQSATAAYTPQKPVRIDESVKGMLVRSIDVNMAENKVFLTFHGAENDAAIVLNLGMKSFRQWLSIIFDQCKKAKWSMKPWPEWMQNSSRRVNEKTKQILQ